MATVDGVPDVESWVPKQENLSQAMHMLQALRDPTRSDHTLALRSLDEYVVNPDFVLIMLHVFAHGAQYESVGLTPDLRQLAGLIIKNYVFPHLARLPNNVQARLKSEVVVVLQDNIVDIRKTAAILVGRISDSFPSSTWSDMLPSIVHYLDMSLYRAQPTAVDGSLQAIRHICEDSALKLSLDEINRPLDALVPRLLALLHCPEASIRINALGSYNSLLYLLSPRGFSSDSLRSRNSSFNDIDVPLGAVNVDSTTAMGYMFHSSTSPTGATSPPTLGHAAQSPLMLHMNNFIQHLSRLASDEQAKIRGAVCQAITTISSFHVAVLDGCWNDVCLFMLAALQDSEESVAIESCEFWAVLLEQPDTKRAMLLYLKTLVEHLICRLYLTSEQMEQDRIDEEEESSGEKELNLRPMHHRVASSGGSSSSGSTTTDNSSTNDFSSPADNDKENSDLSTKWTLRKQAALLLDTVSISFPPADVLNAALPKIQSCFQHADVLVRESGMLALGALSTGCMDALLPHLAQIFPFLLQNFSDPLPEMRSISCWVLGRYCGLFAEMGSTVLDKNTNTEHMVNPEGQSFYQQSLQALLATMFDHTAKVQVAACSALCGLVEASFFVTVPAASTAAAVEQSHVEVNVLISQLPAILTAISQAFDKYGIKSTLILIDTIGTIADTVREELKNPQLTALYFPKLMGKLAELEDLDMRMFPLLECLTSVLSVIGLDAQQYVAAIYGRCLGLLSTVLKAYAVAQEHQINTGVEYEGDLPSKDFGICALDVISALSEGLGAVFVQLVNDTQTVGVLFELMFASMKDDLPELRQSGYSLSGEMCKHSFALLQQQPPEMTHGLLQRSVQSLDTDYPLVCNNAAWTIGELALQVGGDFLVAYIPRTMNQLITALQTAHLQDHLKVNVAVTIGRLAMVDSLEVAELADEYFADWCSVLELPCPLDEKLDAFKGMLTVLHKNPQVILSNKTNFYAFLATCSAWQSPPQEPIASGLREVIMKVKEQNPTMWDRVLNKFSNTYPVGALVQLYQLPL